MLIDLNKTEYLPNAFMLDNTDHIFTWVMGRYEIFDLTEHLLYDISDIANHEYDFCFYEKEDDENFLGVWEIA